MARGDGEREEAWPEDDPPLSDWCRAVSGSRSRAGAGREEGDRGDGDATEDVSDSTAMTGQDDPDPDPETEPDLAWPSKGKGGARSDSVDSGSGAADKPLQNTPSWDELDPGPEDVCSKPGPGDKSGFWL